jgi:hypothetical protein
MKASGLLYATLLSVFLTGITVTHLAWGGSRGPHTALPQVQAAGRRHVADPFASPAARRWRQGQTGHWHDWFLHP